MLNNDDYIKLAKTLSYQTEFDEILRLVAAQSSQLLKADLALILMVNPDTRETVKTVVKDGKYNNQIEYRKIHNNIGGWIINYRKPFFSMDIEKDKRFLKGLFKNLNVKSVAGVPLIVEGIIIGALVVLYKNDSKYAQKSSIELLENIAVVSAPFLRNVQKIRQYFGTIIPENILVKKYQGLGLIGKSLKFIELLHSIEAASRCDVRILLIGKTGTGKELIAKAIHHFSSRADASFITVDCGAIPTTLIESELFGHKRGAFTGANSDRDGLFIKANGGTLFMDEINNLPKDMQSKLLRVLQEGEIRPVGSDESFKIDVRIISASSKSLKEAVSKDMFREDLFYRLHVYPIYIPDLEERQEDIPILSNHFLKKFSSQQNKSIQSFHEEIMDFLKQRIWKGNIRELENFIERLVVLTPTDVSEIGKDSFSGDLLEELDQFKQKQNNLQPTRSLKEQVNNFEAQLIEQILIECNWNQSEAARRLKTSEKNIRYKMEILNITKPSSD